MWQILISWLSSLFMKKVIEPTFNGWIKDTFDNRDQLFGKDL